MTKQIKGLLFDFDGVVLDTDTSYRLIVAEVLAHEFDYPITHEECIKRWKGKNAEQIARELFFEGVEFTDEFVKTVHKRSEKYTVNETNIVKNLEELLDTIDLPKVICSNGRTARIISNLENVNLHRHFDGVLGRDVLGVTKPDPRVYLKGAEFLDLDISNCLVVEDSAVGLKCAIDAGAITVGFIGTGSDKAELAALKPDFIVSDLSEVISIVNSINK